LTTQKKRSGYNSLPCTTKLSWFVPQIQTVQWFLQWGNTGCCTKVLVDGPHLI